MRASRAQKRALAVLPIGFALFDQGAETFLGILEAIELVQENVHGVFKTVAQRQTDAAENGFFRHGEYSSGMAGDAIYEIVHSFVELSLRNEAINDAQVQGAFGGDGLAGEDEFESDFWTNEEWQDRGSKRRENANADFGLGEARLRG